MAAINEPLLAILLPSLHGGGAERVGIELANEFVRRGFAVDMVLMRAEGELIAQLDARVRVVDLMASRARDVLYPLLRYLRRESPSGLIANMWPLTFIAPVVARLSGCSCRVLLVEHNPISRQYRDWGRVHRLLLTASVAIGLRLADERAGVTSGVADDMASLGHFPRRKILTLYNPIPISGDATENALLYADGVWTCSKGRRIMTAGSLKGQKNQKMLLRAFHAMGDKAACLLILGKGCLEGELHALAERLGIDRQVVFAGFHHDPTPFYATADLFVLSSDYEGFGNVIVEALGQGVPVVSTDCPCGPREILGDGKYGALVPVGDALALADAMREALVRGGAADVLKQRARDFSVDRAASAYLDVLLPRRRDAMGVTTFT